MITQEQASKLLLRSGLGDDLTIDGLFDSIEINTYVKLPKEDIEALESIQANYEQMMAQLEEVRDLHKQKMDVEKAHYRLEIAYRSPFQRVGKIYVNKDNTNTDFDELAFTWTYGYVAALKLIIQLKIEFVDRIINYFIYKYNCIIDKPSYLSERNLSEEHLPIFDNYTHYNNVIEYIEKQLGTLDFHRKGINNAIETFKTELRRVPSFTVKGAVFTFCNWEFLKYQSYPYSFKNARMLIESISVWEHDKPDLDLYATYRLMTEVNKKYEFEHSKLLSIKYSKNGNVAVTFASPTDLRSYMNFYQIEANEV